jgi:hypothetical protein
MWAQNKLINYCLAMWAQSILINYFLAMWAQNILINYFFPQSLLVVYIKWTTLVICVFANCCYFLKC